MTILSYSMLADQHANIGVDQDQFARITLDAILQWAKHLVKHSGIQSPPIIPRRLAAIRRVARIETIDIKLAGMLIPLPSGGFIIRLNRSDPLERQNFTCCHEIAHTFFFESKNVKPALKTDLKTGQYERRRFEEYLCDRAAAELLMPEPWFEDAMERLGLSANSIPQLARTFGVSREAAALRLAHSNRWKVCVIKWRFMPRQESVSKLRVDWAGVPDASRLYVPRWKSIAQDSPIFATFERGQPTSAYYGLKLGNLKGEFYIESARLDPDSVLTLVHLENVPIQSPKLVARLQNQDEEG